MEAVAEMSKEVLPYVGTTCGVRMGRVTAGGESRKEGGRGRGQEKIKLGKNKSEVDVGGEVWVAVAGATGKYVLCPRGHFLFTAGKKQE